MLSLVTIGGTLAATGPTMRGFHWALVVTSLCAFVGSMLLFGLLGEQPFLHNSLNSTSSWDAPAVYVYGPAIAVVTGSILYSLLRSRSWYHLATSVMILLAIAGVYGSAVITGLAVGLPFYRLKFQPHHYQLVSVRGSLRL